MWKRPSSKDIANKLMPMEPLPQGALATYIRERYFSKEEGSLPIFNREEVKEPKKRRKKNER
jgi:hypothetical protein